MAANEPHIDFEKNLNAFGKFSLCKHMQIKIIDMNLMKVNTEKKIEIIKVKEKKVINPKIPL